MKPTYTFENGLRKVTPYRLLYKTPAKTRWVGRTLVDIYQDEFGELATLIENDISNNTIYVTGNNGRKGGPVAVQGDVLRGRGVELADILYHDKHMHEPSVPRGVELGTSHAMPSQALTELQIVFEDDELVVINKPSGIPTHPTANYFYNSITEIVKHDLGLAQVWPCHRLDKVTSGILLLGKTKSAAKYYSSIIQQKHSISKEYVARVVGRFPESPVMVNCPVFSVNSTRGFIKPLNADEMPVNSATVFERLAYCPSNNHSIVRCKPLTGRMHQIRIHLRNMGFPIANDYMYNPTNETLSNHAVNRLNNDLELELYRRIFAVHPQFNQFLPVDGAVVNNNATIDVFELTQWRTDDTLVKRASDVRAKRQAVLEALKLRHDSVCGECHRKLFDTNKDMSDLGIWLHAYKYEAVDGFSFSTEFPTWAKLLDESIS